VTPCGIAVTLLLSVSSVFAAPLSIERMGSKLEYLNDKLIEKNYELVRLKSQVQKLGKNSSLGFDR